MADDNEQIQIVAILPGGQFLGLGLIEVTNVDVVLAYLASRDIRAGHSLSATDVRQAYDRAKATQASLERHRAARGINNDADDDQA
jgi:hypothetical protein